jgi:hypothetical protein
MMEPTFTRLTTVNKKAVLNAAVEHNQSFTTVINEVVKAWRTQKDFSLFEGEPSKATEANRQRLKAMKKSRPIVKVRKKKVVK